MKYVFQCVTGVCMLVVVLLTTSVQEVTAATVFSVNYHVLNGMQLNSAESGQVVIDITNVGNEAATNVQLEVVSPAGAQLGGGVLTIGVLQPNETRVMDTQFTLPPFAEMGNTSLVMRVEYMDALGNSISEMIDTVTPPVAPVVLP